MACSKYEYVKKFQELNIALLQTYIVIRIDGKSFTKFCAEHNFKKPVDLRAINLMNEAALFVCENFKDIFLAYGQSDQYSFVMSKYTNLFNRRTDKILSTIVSAFSSAYVFNWNKFFDIPLKRVPIFDSRVIVYPNQKCMKDYFRWRQVDCHINNLYNTTFWHLVSTGKTHQQVQTLLKDTNSAQKNQILYSQFKINYNNLPQIDRKGSIICYVKSSIEHKQLQNNETLVNQQKYQDIKKIQNKQPQSKQQVKQKVKKQNTIKVKQKYEIKILNIDLIQEQFWNEIKI